jgi:proteasome accessory factor C
VTIDYYSLHRGETTTRTVEPHRVFSQDGEWYMRGYCRLAAEERTFRLDRVLGLQIEDETFRPVELSESGNFAATEDDIRVTLRLAPEAAWVAEAYPVEAVSRTKQAIQVTLAVSSLRWLERLLLQLGPQASVVRSEPPVSETLVPDAAERILARYRDRDPDGAR